MNPLCIPFKQKQPIFQKKNLIIDKDGINKLNMQYCNSSIISIHVLYLE